MDAQIKRVWHLEDCKIGDSGAKRPHRNLPEVHYVMIENWEVQHSFQCYQNTDGI